METQYKNIALFYFSGTGNSKQAALWIVEEAKAQNINVLICSIENFEKQNFEEIAGKTLIGFLSPTHGFNLPPVMLSFILKFNILRQSEVFILNCRAGVKIGKIYFPGLSGVAQLFAAIALFIKGYKIAGLQPLDMPSNWISLHPAQGEKSSEAIYKRCKGITERFTKKILSGKFVWQGLISLPIDLIISPISIAYYFVGRFAIAKTFIANSNCTLCGLCQKQCPVKAISLKDKRLFWSYSCESCMRCMNSCPHRAIETAHLYTAIIWFLSISVLLPIINKLVFSFNIFNFAENSIYKTIIEWILEISVYLITIFAGYRILHFILKIKLLRKFIEYTSLTHYKFWRRYKIQKKKN